ncbi:hypothetical protein E3E22_09080 [Thermococcus sp. MV5]|uniref:hypothetical protein n=1 Tax=Thermococcus sp. MV5 TaxID=1638272 RepID=UPI0014397C98|nr:hypothetical protein [Thermococcus sp. MV5]NJE26761.1 hypothetical protein [Thermococcus sp. MV5]
MIIYEPIMLAIPLAEEVKAHLIKTKRFPTEGELKKTLEKLGLKPFCSDKKLEIYKGKHVLVLVLPLKEYITVDILSLSGALSDGIEVAVYHDKHLEAYIIEIIPANELEFEGNIGLEPVIVDANTFELKSTPVLGYFKEEGDRVFLIVEGDVYKIWKESGKLDICPICGAKNLVWKGKQAYCASCGFGVKVMKGE